jgi:hypothetical protein
MSGPLLDINVQRERAARNQALFREVNERIDELNKKAPVLGSTPGYICECLDTACSEMIAMPHDDYARIRRHPNEFFVLPGHEEPLVELVVDKTDRWFVVRKLGVGGEIARELHESTPD